MFTISKEELNERLRAALSTAISGEKINNYRVLFIKEDMAGGENKGSSTPRSICAIALLQYQLPGTREMQHAGVLIDYINEWPLAVVWEDDKFLTEQEPNGETTVQSYNNETGTFSIYQIKTLEGAHGVVLKRKVAKMGKTPFFMAIDPRNTQVVAV